MDEKVIPLTTKRALELCKRSLGSDKSEIETMLNKKLAEAFSIAECAFITRFDQLSTHKELVVMCAEGKGLNKSSRMLKRLAKLHGCKTARMHTKRPALQRLMREFGWVQSEIIFKMEI
ncbi:hypothetical protein [Thalassotalea piscium]|uniref:Uncharacterized protein n=1 Tax=Thalassotalea piscium TaxID=1230533 RepID=A0A7X0NG57_9GAMM|nr:hypothetical protein [Thalassotalea piscium]MBB6542857.1 hypothetical protein [Thalassotalea piscium]